MGQTVSVCVSSHGTLPVFDYIELAQATKNFSQHLGREEECYGILKDGRQISVEVLDQHTFQNFSNRKKLYSRLLPHGNLVSIYGYTNLKEEKFLLVREYISNGTLEDHLHGEVAESRTLPWLKRLDIAIDVANALAYLHNHGTTHKHLNPFNILLDENFCAKLRLDTVENTERASVDYFDVVLAGTLGYIDPDCRSNNFQTDVYSFGVVLCQLLSSKPAKFRERDWNFESLAAYATRKFQNKQLYELFDLRLGFQSDGKIKKMMTATAGLAIQCLQTSGKLRPTISQVLNTLKNIRLPNPELRIFSYKELEEATDRFDKCLGRGSFGAVYYGKLQDGLEIAVKRFHEKDRTLQHFKKEIEVLSLLRHQHLVSLYGYGSDLDKDLLLVYEYISNRTLSFHLHKLLWRTRLNIAIETARALAYLHNSGVIHRDVKPSNILLDDDFSVKVADFGLSRFLPQSGSQGSSTYASHASTDPQGTHSYMDPEYITFHRVSDKSDVYSFGVVLFELISSKPPAFLDGPQFVTLANFAMSKILNKALEELVDPRMQFDFDKKIMETIVAVAELAFQCVQCPKELRPSMKHVLEIMEGIKQGTWEFNQIT